LVPAKRWSEVVLMVANRGLLLIVVDEEREGGGEVVIPS
jgi:hypothetical protein